MMHTPHMHVLDGFDASPLDGFSGNSHANGKAVMRCSLVLSARFAWHVVLHTLLLLALLHGA